MNPKKRLIILREPYGTDSFSGFQRNASDEVIHLKDLRAWVFSGLIALKIFRYSECRFFVNRAESVPRPFLVALLIRLLTYGNGWIEDGLGRAQRVSWGFVFRKMARWAGDGLRLRRLFQTVGHEMRGLELALLDDTKHPLNLAHSPVYLRTDLVFDVRSGGSVGHIAGVLNNLDSFCGKPIFFTTDHIPTVREEVETHIIPPGNDFWDFHEVPSFSLNQHFCPEADGRLGARAPAFVYQRYSVNDYSGLKLSQKKRIPFVLEFNGSEIWVSRHWGNPLKYEVLSEKIELLNLKAANLVVVVSDPLKRSLVERGIEPDKILVNPNGVNPDRYSPQADGAAVREKYGLGGKTVIGFIGTFGLWHGAEVLAEAFAEIAARDPERKNEIRLLLVGNGIQLPRVKTILQDHGMMDLCAFSGLVPQAEGPAHLAACDILVSPTVPNPDGTPFFGSPTKLFEYMAMGKGIVASDLDQIGQILGHDETAWLVNPGSVESLAQGLKVLLEDPVRRERLGAAARKEAVLKYTWKGHTGRIIEKLKEICD